jgi:hypothetical protein
MPPQTWPAFHHAQRRSAPASDDVGDAVHFVALIVVVVAGKHNVYPILLKEWGQRLSHVVLKVGLFP